MWKFKSMFLLLFLFFLDFHILSVTQADPVVSLLNIATSPLLKGKSEYIFKAVPVPDHQNNYFIVNVLGEKLGNESNSYSYNFVFGKNRFWLRMRYWDYPIRNSVIPYSSINKSSYYKVSKNLHRQNSIIEFCNNYFPIPKGEYIYEFSMYDNRRDFELPHYDNFYVYQFFTVEANQSVYIEVDIKNDSYTSKIIDTPNDIFSDMCK